ncbi:anthranilate synthase component II [Carboxydothermus hydrogenoformans]|uniref:Para-aminobenzoate/anthranilate synthase glutamine amidotransferase, component II n=1 Tax=Carboxydothermus hydrogenoformans (strain ATCC BAA-161 / DSM 6008 / Z-2901) TaxID=246194 RepID=Q3AAT4_CARHZ|nr:aminodeoxychorismate/anthranilate synthase component II [Carboxydothermus hydrogenoformans]ABB15625.1 para-aminobenzoate/anthranilate synthase glutamine amidotransferase, component II [Carboxydothermus hydrogenoformans Z-2901]
MLLLIDNYDSFTYNLVQYFQMLGEAVTVYRNDKITVEEIRALNPDYIVISPGPCTPNEAGISLEVIKNLYRYPILGVCLGHQAIGQVFGGKVVRAARPMHGKTSPIYHDGKTIFKGIPSPFLATRYHSLIVELPEETELIVSAKTAEGEIMGLRHKDYPVEGVQFHPEAILTEYGLLLLKNFLEVYRKGVE